MNTSSSGRPRSGEDDEGGRLSDLLQSPHPAFATRYYYLHMPSLSRSTILASLLVLIFSIYMLPPVLRTASNRLAPLARKSILTPSRVGVATTTPLAAFSLFNLGNTASFGSMGRNDIGNDEAPLEPKVVKQDSEWRAQLSPEQVSRSPVHGIRVSFKSLILLFRNACIVPSLEAKGNRSTRFRKVQQAQGRRCIQYVYP